MLLIALGIGVDDLVAAESMLRSEQEIIDLLNNSDVVLYSEKTDMYYSFRITTTLDYKALQVRIN